MNTNFCRKLLFAAIVSLLFIPLLAHSAHADGDLYESAKLVPTNGVGGLWYGYAVDISDGTAVTGARNVESIYVFENQADGTWQENNLDRSQPLQFPWSLAVSGNTVVIGDPFNNSAYVFSKLPTGGWVQEDLQSPPTAQLFGWSVAIEGDTLVVGAILNESVYIFTRNGTAWTEYTPPLTIPDATSVWFGHSLAISGNTLLVGAPPKSLPGSGSAYVFTFDGSTWEKSQTLTTDSQQAGDYFGATVAIDGDALVVGAPQFLAPFTMPTGNSPYPPGSAHLFRRKSDNSWEEEYPVTSPAEGFGSSVAIRGNMMVVGAPFDQYGGVMTGSAYVYSIMETDPSKFEQRLLASDGEFGDLFGWSVAMDGSSVVVGALYENVQPSESGAAYVFTLAPPNQPPIAGAEASPKEVREGEMVFLDASSSSDPDGDPLRYEWVQTSGPEVELIAVSTKSKDKGPVWTFVAPELSEGCAILTLELTVTEDINGEPGLSSDGPATVEVKVVPNNEIHGTLGGKHRHWISWDKYSFYGHENDKVIISLEADLNGWHRGNRATLILKDKIRGKWLREAARGDLPATITAELPADGEYAVYVFKQPWFWFWRRHDSFEGDYILTLDGTCGKLGASSGCKKK